MYRAPDVEAQGPKNCTGDPQGSRFGQGSPKPAILLTTGCWYQSGFDSYIKKERMLAHPLRGLAESNTGDASF